MLSILLVGLDNAGKSTMMGHFKPPGPNNLTEIYPTLGFDIVEISVPQTSVKGIVYDCGGGFRYRPTWDFFTGDAAGVIFVIDCTDRDRIFTVKDVIAYFFKHPMLKNKPISFFFNKFDQPGSVKREDLKKALELDKRKISQPFRIIMGNSITKVGVDECFSFIQEKVKIRV